MEFDLIEMIRARTLVPRDDVCVGIGDDGAVLRAPPGQELVVAIDTMVEGVHFLPGTAAVDLGWKALAVNLSDLAAMGATPAWAMLALTLPRADAAFVRSFAEGFAQLAQPHRVALVGGDTTSGPLSISVAAHGFVPQGAALTRAGANVGDIVLVTGTLGDAIAGLYALRDPPQDDPARATLRNVLIERLTRPTPRVAAAQRSWPCLCGQRCRRRTRRAFAAALARTTRAAWRSAITGVCARWRRQLRVVFHRAAQASGADAG